MNPTTGAAPDQDSRVLLAGIGYASMPISEEARSSALDALERKQTHYAPVAGIEPLRSAVASYLATLGLDVPAQRVIITGGAQEAIFLALQGMTRPYGDATTARGDREARYLADYDVVRDLRPVAIPAVVDPGVRAALDVRERRVTSMPVDEQASLLPTVAAIEQALEQGSKLIYLESPGRLTGSIYTHSQVRQIAGLLQTHDAFCVWDQSAAPAVAGEYKSLAALEPERTAAVGQLWPGQGLETWQIGYVVAPAVCLESLVALKQVLSICTSTPAQWGACGAAQAFPTEHAVLKSRLEAARHQMLSGASGDPRVLPGQSVHVLALQLGDAAAAAHERLTAQGIPCEDGTAYGAPGVLRITVLPEREAGEAIRDVLRGDAPW